MRNLTKITPLITLLTICGCNDTGSLNSSSEKNNLLQANKVSPFFTNHSATLSEINALELSKYNISAINYNNKLSLILLTDIFFLPNTSTLKKEYLESIDRIYDVFNITKASSMVISAHTDNMGDKTNKIALTDGYANAIKFHMWKKGVPQEKITTISMANQEPIAKTEVLARTINRRVQIDMIFKN